MIKCVAPGCRYNASLILMGMSLCLDHRDNWLQIQLSYYRTVAREDIQAYQAYLTQIAVELAHPVPQTSIPSDARVFGA